MPAGRGIVNLIYFLRPMKPTSSILGPISVLSLSIVVSGLLAQRPEAGSSSARLEHPEQFQGDANLGGESAEPGRTFTATETSLGKQLAGFVEGSAVVSPDGNHVAYIVRQGSSKFVVMDGRAGRPYPDIPEQPLTERGRDPQIRFSPDGKRLAYVAHRPGGYFVVVDGIEGPPFEHIATGAPVFSPDSKRMAYIAERDSKQTVVVDGIQDPPCSYVAAVPIRFSPDSKHMAYPARRGDSTVAIMDGKDIDRGQHIGFIRFSNDGRHYAYVVLDGETRRVVVDGVSGKSYSRVGNEVVFSADSKHFLYRATGAGGDFIVLDGQEGKYRGIIRENEYDFSPGGRPVYLVDTGPGAIYVVVGQDLSGPYDRVMGTPRFSADGSRFAFAIRRGDGKSVVVTDGAEGPKFDEVNTIAFSPRGNRLVYTASTAGKQYAVLDGVRAEYEAIAHSAFSPDGEHLALSVKIDGQWVVSIDGASGKPCGGQIFQLVLSRGGKHNAVVCQRDGRQLAVIDGVSGKPYDNIERIQFSAAGAAAYAASANARPIVVVDMTEISGFDSLLTPLIFDGPSYLHFVATRRGEFIREEIKFSN